MEKLRRRNAPSLLEWSRSLRFTLSDPNFSVCPVSITWDNPGSSRNASSLLYLKGLARKLGLKFMALRGGAVYLSTEAFYLEIKENGEEILHILNPESIEILPRGGDLVAHLKGLMELKPSNWKGLSTLQDELKSILGDDLIPRVGGTPAQIRLFDNYTALSILPQNNHFVLRIRDPFPLAEEKLTELGKICGFNLFELVGPRGGYLMDLIVPDSPLFMVDSLNEKGFQDVVCYPGANIKVCASNKLATNSSQLGFSSCLESLSSRKNNLFDERILKPCVSITPVSNTSTILQVQNTKKIGIEIIPLGSGVNSSITSKKLLNKTYRDIKRSLSEDDKRSRSLKKGKKRRHPSTLAIDKSPSLSPKNKNCTFSCSYSSKAIAKLQNKSIDSLRETIKHKSTNKNLLAPRDSSSKSLLCNTSKFFKKRNKDKEKQTQEDEVKRLLGGGKLLNKTFHIPKINTVTCLKNTEQYDNLNDKKIPSLMSLQPSIYSKESLNTTFLKSSVGYASISSIVSHNTSSKSKQFLSRSLTPSRNISPSKKSSVVTANVPIKDV
nr:uncharacterized protein LOC121127336 isoform X2 [Lepeophtheirus salmonis]